MNKTHDIKAKLWGSPVILIAGIAFLVLFFYTLFNDKLPTKNYQDEFFHITNLRLFKQYGLSTTFLDKYYAAPGPLYTFVQYGFLPITRGILSNLRAVNAGLVLVLMGVTFFLMRYLKKDNPVEGALAYMFIPTTYVVGGLILTEPPAMICSVLTILMLLFSVDSSKNIYYKILYALLAGIFLGFSIIGRQSFLALIPFQFLLVFRTESRIKNFFLISLAQVVAACVYLPLFIYWKGLVVPTFQFNLALRPEVFFSALAVAFTGLFILIIAPKWYSIVTRRTILLYGATILIVSIINAIGDFYSFAPNKAILYSLFDKESAMVKYISSFFASVAISSALLVFYLIYQHWVNDGKKVMDLFFYLCFLTVAMTCMNFDKFGTRYVFQALPFLMPMICGHITNRIPENILRIVFAVVGLVSLHMTL